MSTSVIRDVPMGHGFVAKAVKNIVKIPVMMEFRQLLPIAPALAGESLILGICRPNDCVPTFPGKYLVKRRDFHVSVTSVFRLYYHQPIILQPTVGREGQPEWGYYGFTRQQNQKWLLSAEATGIVCAAVAARKGHQVSKNDSLGGSINLHLG